jgi:phytoene synthase
LTIRRYATWSALRRDCQQLGGSLARIIACVLGVTTSDVTFVDQLGVASRLTNILTNLGRDVARDYIYLPLEDLARFQYSERELRGGIMNDRCRELVRFEVVRAREWFDAGSAGLCWLARDGSRMAAATFVAMQTATLDAIERARFDIFTADLRLPLARQLRQLPVAWELARR